MEIPPPPYLIDGKIDFSHYSPQQLKELRSSIDPRTFPLNHQALLAALELLERQTESGVPADPRFEGRLTPLDGIRGWYQAKRRRSGLYGSGAIEVQQSGVILRGWQRTWLGNPLQAEAVVASEEIRNVTQEGNIVRFEYGRRFRPKRVEFALPSDEQAQALTDLLPKTASTGFEKRWTDLRSFNESVRLVSKRTWVTPTLVAANIAVFIALAAVARLPGNFPLQLLLNWGANYAPLTVNGQWWRLVTALFLHLNLLHLLLNMWALWNVGRLAERLFGSGPLLLLYLCSGVLASLTSVAWDPGHASVGASGAIFGVFGAFLAFLMHPRTQVPSAVFKPYWLSTLAFVLFNLISGALQTGVDNAAHVGGLASGLVLGWMLARPMTVEARAHWPLRQASVAAAFSLIIGLAAVWQITGLGAQLTVPEQYFRTHAWFVTGEAQNLRSWQEFLTRSGAGTLSDADFGNHFDADIVPFWKSSSERLEKENQTLSGEQRAFAMQTEQYAKLRYRWAQTIVVAAHTREPYMMEQATDLAKQTDLAVARLERMELRASMDHRPHSLSSSSLVVHVRQLFSPTRSQCVEAPGVIYPPAAATDSKLDGPGARYAAGCRAQRLFLSGDYATLDKEFNAAASRPIDLPDGGSTLSGLVGGLSDLFTYGQMNGPDAFGRTSDWRRSVPHSINADLVEVLLFETWAWSARGHATANEVTAQAWSTFAHRTEMAAAGLSELAPRAGSNPLWYQLSLDVGLDQGLKVDQLRAIFDQGKAKFPEYLPLYSRMLRILMPRWLGSYAQVDEFIEEQAASFRTDADPLAYERWYARLYWLYGVQEGDRTNIFQDAKAHWSTMKRGFDELHKRYAGSDSVFNAYGKYACIARDPIIYGGIRSELRRRPAASIWSTDVSMESCDRALVDLHTN
jgi:membrane associated rhomboid family serine protease